MSEHPAAGYTKAQIEAFELIAVNQTTDHSAKALKALAAKGLIEFVERSSSDALGKFTWKEPFVPPALHAQWCDWCADNV